MRDMGLLMLFCILLLANFARAKEGEVAYLSDLQHRFLYLKQGWGVLGIDTCAHAPGVAPLPLQIKDRHYSRGLGNHAPGEIVIDLAGQYSRFLADCGVQWQNGNVGSVEFKVYVDGKLKFSSGVMREQDPPKHVDLSVAGAYELRLVATDAGDGIICDCADWADARLVKAAKSAHRPPSPALDIAPFACVTTSDPDRQGGVQATRVEEFPASGLDLETPLSPDGSGLFPVPFSPDKPGVLGLNWTERRYVRTATLVFPPGTDVPDPARITLQAWFGQSLWQGKWHSLEAPAHKGASTLTFALDGARDPLLMQGLWKLRWLFSPDLKGLSLPLPKVESRARTAEVALRCELSASEQPSTCTLTTYNGLVLSPDGPATTLQLDLAHSRKLKLRYAVADYWPTEHTVLRFELPSGACAVAVDDVLQKGAVWVPAYGLYVSTLSAPDLASYKAQIAGKQTLLQRVRALPEQTFSRALEKTHHACQDEGPVQLSLACDNAKFIVHRLGRVDFGDFSLVPSFASGKAAFEQRRLRGKWLPAPEMAFETPGLTYSECAYVVPFDAPEPPGWLASRPVCVLEFTLSNSTAQPQPAALGLDCLANAEQQVPADVERAGERLLVVQDDRIFALCDLPADVPLRLSMRKGRLDLEGTLPPQTTVNLRFFLPAWEMTRTEAAAFSCAFDTWQRFETYWHALFADKFQVQLPDEFLSDVIRASQVHCLLAARNEKAGALVAPWCSSRSYGALDSESNPIIWAMALWGHQEFARRSLEYFIARYSPAGYLTTGYTLVGTGWHLLTLADYSLLYHDRAWLEREAPKVSKVCDWVVAQLHKARRLAPDGSKPFYYGLVPPGVLADWNNFQFFFMLEALYQRGLENAARALLALDWPGAGEYLAEATQFKADLRTAFHHTQALAPVAPLRDGTWVPFGPSAAGVPWSMQAAFGAEDVNRAWAYDVELGPHHLVARGVLPPHSREADWLLEQLEDGPFLKSGWFDYPAEENEKDWFDLGGFPKVQPYYAQVAQCYALRDDPKPFLRTYFNSLAAMLNTEVLSLWEHFHDAGAWNKTHETAYFLEQTRLMLLQERRNELWLAPLIPSSWLAAGKTVSVQHAPTRFGRVSYRLASHLDSGYVEAEITCPADSPPARLVLALRIPGDKRLQRVLVNGRPAEDFDADRALIYLAPASGTLTVQAFY